MIVRTILTSRIFKFKRERLGNKTVTPYGEVYGKYLYRNVITKELVASHDKPKKGVGFMYKGEDIGYNTDALIYYKNR